MSAGQPLWLKAVLRLERAIGEPVETVAHSNTYFDAVAVAVRAARASDRRGRGRFAALPAPREPPPAPTCGASASSSSRIERRLIELEDEQP